MAIVINSNVAALQAQRSLGRATRTLRDVFERLSSGQRINRAADDAAGLAIAENLGVDRRVLNQGIRNLNDGASLLDIAEGALGEMSNIVVRLRELAEQSANGTLGNKQRAALDAEAQSLAAEYLRISRTTAFNGLNLFDGSATEFRFQSGYGANGGLVTSLGGELGTGAFGASTTFANESTNSYAIALGDVNDDGILDLVTAGEHGTTGAAFVRLGTGSGSFGAAQSYATETVRSNSLVLADANDDGILDLITAGESDEGSGVANIRFGNGDGTFRAATSYQTETTYSNSVTMADLNGDGRVDLITGGQSGASTGYLTIHYGLGSGSFGSRTTLLAENRYTNRVEAVDVNGDRILDLVTSGLDGSGNTGRATVQLGNGNGTFKAQVSYVQEPGDTNGLALGDLNGDGYLDLITAGRTPGFLGFATIRFGRGDGSFGASTSIAAETFNTFSVRTADLNGDGILDLMTAGRNVSSDDQATVFLGNGDGTFRRGLTYGIGTLGTDLNELALGDIDSDGVLDFVGAGFTGASSGFITTRLGSSIAGVSPLLPFTLATKSGARQAMAPLKAALDRINAQRSIVGAAQSRIATALATTGIASENYERARSQLRDADMAEETAALVRTQIIQQAATAILAQAKTQPQLALTLLG